MITPSYKQYINIYIYIPPHFNQSIYPIRNSHCRYQGWIGLSRLVFEIGTEGPDRGTVVEGNYIRLNYTVEKRRITDVYAHNFIYAWYS